MARLTTTKPRLRAAPPRLTGAHNPERKGVRRSEGPVNTAAWQRLRIKVLFRDAECFRSRSHLIPPGEWPSFKEGPLFRPHPFLWPVCQRTGVLLIGGKTAPNSAVVDHIQPHRGNMDLFWDERNLMAVAKSWHDKTKQSLEKRGLA